MDKFEEIDQILGEYRVKTYPLIDIEDIGKEGIIVDIEKVSTNYGKIKIKLLIDINKRIKVAFINLLTINDWMRKLRLTHTKDLLGKSVRIVLVEVLNPTTKQILQKPKPYIIG